MASTCFRFTLLLTVVFSLQVGVYTSSCPSGCRCKTELNVGSGVKFYIAYCKYNNTFDGGITKIFSNRPLPKSNSKENIFYFNNLRMPVWKESDSEVIAELANDNASYIEIELRETRTGLIDDGALEPLANLTLNTLRLHNLPLTNLKNNTFVSLKKLKSMEISEFKSGTNQGNFFYSLPGLTTLNVSASKEFVEKDIIYGDHRLYSLKYLDLRRNNLMAIPTLVFSHMTNLLSVRLGNNGINVLPELIFLPSTSLQSVHFEDNRLTTLSEKIFSPLSSLHSFHLENNRLTEFKVDLCLFLLNRTSNDQIDIYLENNYISNFDYAIASWSNCTHLLPSNKVVHIEIQADKNFYCDTKYILRENSKQSLTISAIGADSHPNCKTTTLGPENSPTDGASQTTSNTMSLTQMATTPQTSVTTSTTTTTSTKSTTTHPTSMMTSKTTTSGTQRFTTSEVASASPTTHSSTTESTTITRTRGTFTTASQSQSNIRAVSDQPHTDHQYKYKPLSTGVLVAIGLGGVVLALVAVWIVRRYSGANIPQGQESVITVFTSHTPGLIDVDPRPQTGRPLPTSDKSQPGPPTDQEPSVEIRARRVTVTIPLPDPPDDIYLHAEPSECSDVISS